MLQTTTDYAPSTRHTPEDRAIFTRINERAAAALPEQRTNLRYAIAITTVIAYLHADQRDAFQCATIEGLREREWRVQGRRATPAELIALAERRRDPACGHSACAQFFIDTGENVCVDRACDYCLGAGQITQLSTRHLVECPVCDGTGDGTGDAKETAR